MVEIAGIVKFTLIDYPGHAACTIFFQGCNFRCRYCQNYKLIERRRGEISEEYVFEFLEERKGIIDAVVLSGGEPLLQDDLEEFIKNLRKLGFKIKLDTNGYLFENLKHIIKLVDYVAMDIKAKMNKYEIVTGRKINIENILMSIDLIKNHAKDYEFRTTVVPGLIDEKDIEEIARIIRGAKLYTIQNFNNKSVLDKKLSSVKPYSYEEMIKFKSIAERYVKNVKIRNV